MARKRNPADAAVEYFQTADLAAAASILDVCSGILKRRQREQGQKAPGATRRRERPASPAASGSSATAAQGAAGGLLDGSGEAGPRES